MQRIHSLLPSIGRLAIVGMLIVLQLAPAAAGAATATVDIGTTLSPSTLTVTPGTSVTWTNNDDERHRVRSQTGPEEFDSGNLDPGESFTFTFTLEGTYSYVDDRDEANTAYHGTVVVSAEPEPDPGTPPPPPPAVGDVNIVDRSFVPATIEISAGGSVTWANNDTEEHTVTATDQSWDSGIFDTGGVYTKSFADPGTYTYFCIIHPDMTGTVIVSGSDGTPPPPPPDPEPEPDPTPPPPPPPGDVMIVDFAFEPGSMTVALGSTITWSNAGAAPHTVTANDGSFDSGFLFAGDTYSRTFTTSGTFNYFCTLHPEMVATVVVTSGDGAPPPPADPPPDPAPGPDPEPPPTTASGDVDIVDNAFSPGSITVDVGATVTWVNTGALPHTVTANGGAFDSGILLSGAAYSRTFTAAGTYNYFCTIHPEMTGTILVLGADGSAPPATDPPPGGDTAPTAPPASVSGDVNVIDNAFSPSTITVAAGGSVTWANNGQVPHTVTRSGDFDSGLLMPGNTYTRTFQTPGTFSYVCTLHPGMSGTVLVTDASGVAPPEEPGAGEVGGDTAPVVVGPSDVAIIDNGYRPGTITVGIGQSIKWVNTGQLPHTVTARSGMFDSGLLMTGDGFRFTPAQSGTIEYFCTIHPEMVGTIVVTDEVVADPALAAAGDGTIAAGSEAVASAGDPVAGTEIAQSVEVVDFDYKPGLVIIEPGQAVKWTNVGEIPHTVTARDGSFDSGIFEAGGEYVRVFDSPGTYEYFCTLHPNMVGTVEVVGPDADTAAAAAGDGGDSSVAGAVASGAGGETVAWVVAGAMLASMLVFAVGLSKFIRTARPA